SLFLNIKIPDSVIELNSSIKVNFTINENLYTDEIFINETNITKNKPIKEKILSIKNINIHYEIFSPENKEEIKGKFLMIHGFAGSTFSFNRIAPLLARLGYLVVAIDLPNFGYSDRARIKFNSNCFADLIFNFINQFEESKLNSILKDYSLSKDPSLSENFKKSKWNIVGHSMAGRILSIFTYKYKSMVNSLTLISPAFFGSTHFPVIAMLPPFNLFLYLYISSALQKVNFAKLLEKVYLRKPEDFEVENYLKPLLIPGTFQNVIYMLDTPEDEKFKPQDILNKIDLPVLLIWGKKDNIVPLKKSIKFIDKIKDKKLIVIEDAGHNSMETHFDIVINKILEYLAYLEYL
ncbi:MAG: alpha/beta hydrolase, partial [Exilispira sp.]